VEFDGMRPLASAVAPSRAIDVGLGAPRAQTTAPVGYRGAVPLLDFFDRRGLSLVAGRAALLPTGADPNGSLANAARAGAVAVLFYGADLPAGGISLDESGPIPAVSIADDVAARLLTRLRHGVVSTVSLGAVRTTPNTGEGHVAQFSSTGLAYDGRVKPDVLAPGVAVETSEPGSNADGSARYGTVNGTSVAAALVAGGAALLAQARPYLDADALKGLLVGSARPLADDSITSQGAGLVDVGGAAATEFAAAPASLAFGRAATATWRAEQVVAIRNVSFRRVILSFRADVAREGAAPVQFDIRPLRVSLATGRTVRVHIRARLSGKPQGNAPVEGLFVATPAAGGEVHVPWTILFGSRVPPALTALRLSTRSFRPSDAAPSQLSFVAGSVARAAGRAAVLPLSRLDLELWSPGGGRIGLLARLRDVLPGRYSFGVTGRDPTGASLPSGEYQLRLLAYGTDPGPPTVRTVAFTIK
jgi:hypothetical protein